ncbi:hypothetical protein JW964_06300 [candidate division KSB1 bacterium]|nr:hypothetical protein [candidate division KSB1 bacterium]
MAQKRIIIWVEGADDQRFFEHIIKPFFEKNYELAEVRTYATLKKNKFSQFIKSLNAISIDYICVADINNSPCITAKKQKISDKFKINDMGKIFIVVKEIEGWYLAGIDATNVKNLKIKPLPDTDELNKENFNQLVPKKFISRLDFMSEILKEYSIEYAINKNRSFRYFIQRHSSIFKKFSEDK